MCSCSDTIHTLTDANLKHLQDYCTLHPEKTPCSSGYRLSSDRRYDHQSEATQYATLITYLLVNSEPQCDPHKMTNTQ